MKVSDIALLSIDEHTPEEKQRLRRQAPKLIASIINDTFSLPGIPPLDQLRPEHIKALSGGKDALAYLVNHPAARYIIKVGTEGILAEEETIAAWKKRSVRVPGVVQTGIIPSTRKSTLPLRYLIEEAMLDTNGRLIETADDYLTHSPKQARQIGQQLGKELNKIHSCVSDRLFGEFKDSQGSSSSYRRWNGYVIDSLRRQEAYLAGLRIDGRTFQAVTDAIDRLHYVKKGRYLHGDFSVRNAAVKSRDPLKISVFDPNPLIGDPSWDVSFLVNKYEFMKRRQAYDASQQDLTARLQQVWTGFKQRYSRRIPDQNLMSAQLVQAIYQAQYTESIDDAIGFRVRREFIQELCTELGR